ncbi:hypothetical protein MRX96_048977 [Rhipicephalus microplus]
MMWCRRFLEFPPLLPHLVLLLLLWALSLRIGERQERKEMNNRGPATNVEGPTAAASQPVGSLREIRSRGGIEPTYGDGICAHHRPIGSSIDLPRGAETTFSFR